MLITGIELIRANHEALPVRQDIKALPGEKVELTYGDRLRVNASLDYKGPELTGQTLYGAIGARGLLGFDEKVVGQATVTFPKSDTFAPWSGTVDIPITADIEPGENYDLYIKIKEYPGAGMPEVDDIIAITGIPPTFTLLEETIYPYAYIYEGATEACTFTFTTDPFHPTDWVAGKLAAQCEDKIRKAGGRVMEMRVYVDKTPLLWTNWRIEVVYRPPASTAGIVGPLGYWQVIIGIILVIVALIALIVVAYNFIIKPLTYKRKPNLADVKVAWAKDTLIKTIQDAEEYWKRTPTPPETLDAMSEDELRDYLDKIAEEELPPTEGAGLGLAVAAVGVLGVGALALGAYAMSQRKEAKR